VVDGCGGAAPPAGAALFTTLICPPGTACLSSVLKVPELESKTRSVLKLGVTAWPSCLLGCSCSKVIEGRPRVKLSISRSKSRGRRAVVAATGLGVGRAGWRVGTGAAACSLPSAMLKRAWRAVEPACGLGVTRGLAGRRLAACPLGQQKLGWQLLQELGPGWAALGGHGVGLLQGSRLVPVEWPGMCGICLRGRWDPP
jgi:hypothetical protein